MDPVSKWIASVKIPIGKWGKAFFDWLTTTFDGFFGAIADGLNFFLDGLVDLLLYVPPVILCLLIAALAWWLQRSRALAIGVFLGLDLHPQPGPVEADSRDAGAGGRSLCRLHGDRRADRHLGRAQAESLSHPAAGPRPDADAADLRLPDPGADPVRPRQRAGPDRHHHLRDPDRRQAHPSRHGVGAEGHHRGRRSFRRHQADSSCGRWNCPRRCRPSWRA